MASANPSKRTWVPRVLKKRPNAFNVAAGLSSDNALGSSCEKLEGAAAAPATAMVPEWGGQADLDDLPADDEEDACGEPSSKRARTDAMPGAGSGKAVVAKEPKDEIIEAAPRLATHIATASKFNKVAAMAYSLLESGQVTRKNAHAFLMVLEAGLGEPKQLRRKELRVAYRRLYTAACDREDLFPPSAAQTLQLWRVHVLLQLDLYTDDNFQFSRAARQVREWLEKLPCIYPALEPANAKHMPEGDRQPWVEVIFDCIEVAVMHYKHLWAKTTVDILIRAVVDRRQNFSQVQQATIQEWNAMCKGQKIQRQQEHARNVKDQTAYEKKEAEWNSSDIKKTQNSWAKDAKNAVNLGGLDAWAAKQISN
eukprot:CAMPEP_0119360326 /NCGR_PEP_ID=MMETSP1334-20130426/7967_1 /TAXON_ID=127549 /ORGANISM="Calcidiscus leptoporus, Strain RCC1130" /LENGTH=366 /DNA_ID=CAMNT_0007375151 /DNA_START=13 /DNA_END=1113 /DNA_ORIENTATION=+